MTTATIGQPYTSGSWLVSAGREDEFVSAWNAFTGWSLDHAPGAQSFVLIRDAADPRRFLSLGAWSDADAVEAWRSSDEFRERLGRCRALCDDFEARDYTAAAAPQRTTT
jgi:heme-degrading monooxygenase HmoA